MSEIVSHPVFGEGQVLDSRWQGTEILVRFRSPDEKPPLRVTVNGRRWTRVRGDWVELPGNIGKATIRATY